PITLKTAGPQSVTVTAMINPAVGGSAPVTVNPAPASQLVIHRQPSSAAMAGQPFAPQPVIYVEDMFGNLETGDNSTQVMSSQHMGMGPLRGTTPVRVSGGVATFTDLADNKAEIISLDFTT